MQIEMKACSSREIIALLKADGWYLLRTVGSHHQFGHPMKKGRVTLPHPKRDLPFGTVKSVFAQAGLDWRRLK